MQLNGKMGVNSLYFGGMGTMAGVSGHTGMSYGAMMGVGSHQTQGGGHGQNSHMNTFDNCS